MEEISYIFILFGLLFIIETKAINILLAFVGLIITLAVKLTYFYDLTAIKGEYFTYILILVQVSALTILFGFIIMLFPYTRSSPTPVVNWNSLDIRTIRVAILITILAFFYTLFYTKYFVYLEIYLRANYPYLKYALNPTGSLVNVERLIFYYNKDPSFFLRKLGTLLYTVDSNILKLIFLTLILLLAIVILFFLV